MSPAPAKKPDDKPDEAETPKVDSAQSVEPGVVPTEEQSAKAAESVPADAITGEEVAAKPGFAHDPLDAGVPQEPGKQHQGPDDAFNPVDVKGETGGEPRADYTARVGAGTVHHTTEVIPESERVPGGPTSRLVPQVPAT